MAAAALIFAACSSDNENTEWAGEIRLSSSLSVQETATRAGTDVQSTAFDANKEINVYISENTTGTATTTYPQPLVYTTGENGVMAPATQPYFPSSGNGVNIYAVYPTTATGSSFTIQTNQTDDEDYKASDLMYGAPANNAAVERTSSTIPLTFNHLLSKVTIKLVAGSGGPTVNGAEVKLLNVQPTIAYTVSSSGSSLGAASGTATSITVMDGNGAEGSAVIPPQTLEDKEFIVVTLPEGGTLYGSLTEATAGPTFASGNEYIYTITVNLTNLSISSAINKWNSDDNAADGTATMD